MTNETGGRKLLFLMTAEKADAFARLVEAAGRGDGGAACRLGDLYREGLGGVRYSPKEAHRWYAKSALAGDPNGQNNLGACNEHGLGCAQSYAKAVKWYRLSVAQGLSTASMNLGYCYLHGHGVTRDQVEALRLFRIAVAGGEDRAVSEVERLEAALGVRGLQLAPEDTGQSAAPGDCSASLAGTQQALPCVLARRVPRRDGLPERLQSPDAERNHSPEGPRKQLQPLQTALTDIVANAPHVITQELSEPDASASSPTGNANRERERSKVQVIRGIKFVDRTEPGRHFGVVGAGGVSPPESGDDAREESKAGWTDEDFERVSLGAWEKDDCFDLPEPGSEYARVLMAGWDELLERLGVPLTTDAEAESRHAATEQDLFPTFAESGLQPGDLVGGIAERYAEYLKRRTQQ